MAFSYFCLRSFAHLGHQQQVGVQWSVNSQIFDNEILIMRAFDNENTFYECTNIPLIILVNVSVKETRASAIKIGETVGNF